MSSREIFWEEEKREGRQEIEDWDAITTVERRFLPPQGTSERWIFRGERLTEKSEQQYFPQNGQAHSCQPQGQNEEEYLETHLEKAFRLCGVRDEDKIGRERELIRTFQRKAALYLDHEPDKDDILEWLAIMRHHGAPTRLLDWGYSFYIAVYFALSENNGGIVWALDVSTINTPKPIEEKIGNTKCHQRYEDFKGYFQEKSDKLGIRKEGDKLIDLAIACYFMEHPFPCVYPVNPFRLNKRLSVQQGLFLMTGDITKSFAENLTATLGGVEETKHYLRRVKITPDRVRRNEILKKLKDMNISNEALFPGLDGFARSVGEGLAYPRPLGDWLA